MGGALYHARMNRTSWLAVVTLALLLGGVWLRLRWPDAAPAIDCPPGSVRLDDAGVAFCGDGAPLPAAKALTLGQKLDLNRASAEDLARVPGVGEELARVIVAARERDGGFRSWDEVDDVPGVGLARLEALMQATELRPADGG